MDIKEYLQPVKTDKELNLSNISSDSWINTVDIFDKSFPDWQKRKIAVIGIISEQFPYEANNIRSSLYALKKNDYARIICDLGNFKFDQEDPVSYEKLAYLVSELHSSHVIPLILGSTQEITYSQYLANEYLKKLVNIALIDQMIDFNTESAEKITNENYLYKILLRDPSYLFNISHLAFQTYLTDSMVLDSMEKYHFELMRLGKLRENISEIEPVTRSTDILSFDISAIRQCDAPASCKPSPNGLSAEEACMITRYAGLSDNLSSIGFYEYSASADVNNQTAFLIAQMIWYFVDGFLQRPNENIVGNPDNFTKYITSDTRNTYKIIFYKSLKTNRWWMQIPVKSKDKNLLGKQVVPCSYHDYLDATSGVIPERWIRGLKRSEI